MTDKGEITKEKTAEATKEATETTETMEKQIMATMDKT